MPTLTLLQANEILDSYVEPDGDFRKSINQVLSRIYNMGTYRDLTVQYSLPVVDGAITLPDDADAVLHVMVDGSPAPVRSMWHDYKSRGLLDGNGAGPSWGLIDAGFWPILRLIPSTETVDTLYVVPSVLGVSDEDIDFATGETIVVTANDADATYQSSMDNVGKTLTFDSPITSISKIRFDGLQRAYDIRYAENDPESRLATVGPDSGVTRYRRFRVDRATDGETVVHVLCKRAFIPLRDETDVLYVTNLGALKHGLLARIADDNADIERAQYHWNQCMLLLEEEASSTRGAAIPRLNIDPYGTGGLSRISQMY